MLREREGQRERKRERENPWERETSVGCFPYAPQLGIKPANQACALTGNQTYNLSVHRTKAPSDEPHSLLTAEETEEIFIRLLSVICPRPCLSEQQSPNPGVWLYFNQDSPWYKYGTCFTSGKPRSSPLLPSLSPWDSPRGHPKDPGKNSTPGGYF